MLSFYVPCRIRTREEQRVICDLTSVQFHKRKVRIKVSGRNNRKSKRGSRKLKKKNKRRQDNRVLLLGGIIFFKGEYRTGGSLYIDNFDMGYIFVVSTT